MEGNASGYPKSHLERRSGDLGFNSGTAFMIGMDKCEAIPVEIMPLPTCDCLCHSWVNKTKCAKTTDAHTHRDLAMTEVA